MRSRERVLKAMCHEQPDRVPLFYRDVPEVETRLLKDLGLPDRDALLAHLDIDFRWVAPRYVGPPLDDPQTGRRRDIWGVEYQYVEGGHGGQWEPTVFPLAEVEDIDALDQYAWPQVDWFDFDSLQDQLDRYQDYAIMTSPGVASPGVFGTIQFLLGMERTMLDMLLRPEFLCALRDRIVAFFLDFVRNMYDVAGDRIDFFRTGDDFGTQRGLLFGFTQWEQFVRPIMVELSRVPKQCGSYYYHHSCGAIRELIPHLIDIGVDVVDPIQVKAVGMVPAELKAEFGDRVCFSGGVDEQELLPRGTPQEIRDGVAQLLDVMAPGGGFFVGPTHNFQVDIPTENIVAMYEEARAWKYGQ